MGNRDFRKREKKKPRKDLKKPLSITPAVFQPQITVEVIKRGKKTEEEEEEQ